MIHSRKVRNIIKDEKQYRLEDDLMKKSRPKWNSKRYRRLEEAAYAAGFYGLEKCERCGAYLFNPQSILIHQGGHCQKLIKKY